MTYKEAINQVLSRLREPLVSESSIATSTPYSALIGILLNDAKSEIEAAWNWSGLRNTITVTTASGVFAYELNGTGNSSTFLSVINDTTNSDIKYATANQFNSWYLKNTPASGSPTYYSFNGVSADGDTLMEFYPKPTGAETIRINYIAREVDFTSTSTDIEGGTYSIPARPIILLAYAKAVEERGEDGGVGAGPAFAIASRSLSDAIQLDAQKHPEETIWEAV